MDEMQPDDPRPADELLVQRAFGARQGDDQARLAPPDGLWAAIEQEISGTDRRVPGISPVPEPPPATVNTSTPTTATTATTVTALVRRPRRDPLRWLAVAAAVATLAAGGWLFTRSTSRPTMMTATLTNDGLSPLGNGAHGSASVRRNGAHLDLSLSLDRPPVVDGSYLEVWLIDTAVAKMVSLGPYHGNGAYPIPAGYDPAAFPVVDISIEPADGEPKHSSVSALRGLLNPTTTGRGT